MIEPAAGRHEAPPASVPPRRRPATSPIDARTAVVGFLGAWVLAQVLAAVVLGITGEAGSADDTPIGVLAIALIASWSCYLAVMWMLSERLGTADPVADYGISFHPVDALGIGVGILSQLVVVQLVYLPLEAIWPETFSEDKLAETAEGLVDRSDGLTLVVLFAVVVVGAPIVEELFYRGLLQRSLLTRFGTAATVVLVAGIFAVLHFRPVEYPGLFAFGLIVGVCAAVTGRLGMAIVAHIAFNATGLVLVL